MTTIAVRPDWPRVICDGPLGVHRFYLELGTWWLCRWCDAEVQVGAMQQVFEGWDWVVARAMHTEKVGMN